MMKKLIQKRRARKEQGLTAEQWRIKHEELAAAWLKLFERATIAEANVKRLDQLWSETAQELLTANRRNEDHDRAVAAHEANELLLKDKHRLQMERDYLKDELARRKHFDQAPADALRAMVLQMRVFQMGNKGRTGYGVTSFIPTEVVQHLKECPPEQRIMFRDLVFTQALEYAFKGIFHVNSRGNISAVLFAPLGDKGICGAMFDQDKNFQIETAKSTATDPTVRAIENRILAEQRGEKVDERREYLGFIEGEMAGAFRKEREATEGAEVRQKLIGDSPV